MLFLHEWQVLLSHLIKRLCLELSGILSESGHMKTSGITSYRYEGILLKIFGETYIFRVCYFFEKWGSNSLKIYFIVIAFHLNAEGLQEFMGDFWLRHMLEVWV